MQRNILPFCVFFAPSTTQSLSGRTAGSMHTSHSPMFSVTVMMFRDMVESVMLLKDDDCNISET